MADSKHKPSRAIYTTLRDSIRVILTRGTGRGSVRAMTAGPETSAGGALGRRGGYETPSLRPSEAMTRQGDWHVRAIQCVG
jgi:hypothetical protein